MSVSLKSSFGDAHSFSLILSDYGCGRGIALAVDVNGAGGARIIDHRILPRITDGMSTFHGGAGIILGLVVTGSLSAFIM